MTSRYPLSSSSQQLVQSLQTMAGREITRSAGMVQGSTVEEQLADLLLRRIFSELHTGPYRVERWYNSDTEEWLYRFQLLTVDLTLKVGSGTLPAEHARLLRIASQGRLSGGSLIGSASPTQTQKEL